MVQIYSVINIKAALHFGTKRRAEKKALDVLRRKVKL